MAPPPPSLRAMAPRALGALVRCSEARGSPPAAGREARGSPPAAGREARGSPPAAGREGSAPTTNDEKSCTSRPITRHQSDVPRPVSTRRPCPPLGRATPPPSIGVFTKKQCVLCHRECSDKICDKCVACLKISLLDANLDAAIQSSSGAGSISYCISCAQIVRGTHEQHQGRTIPLRPYRKSWTAWDTRCESWSSLFDSVQLHTDQSYDDSDVERPFLLKPPPGRRCEVCLDMVASPATLYGTLVRHCTVECWLKSKGAAADLEWANAIVREEFSAEGANAFCVTCASGFRRGKACHDGHVVFSVEGGMRPRVRIPGGHSIARALDSVKDWAGGEMHSSVLRQIVIRDRGAPRCARCKLRLLNVGCDTCCLQCALPLPKMFVPRSLQVQKVV